ncbi:MAG: hypothetical protein IPJ00_11030 [Saprospirales bacterium]|nr:hypothetical protein [Saprospirales bacterium]
MGGYSTNYEYDLAGNILSLQRNGLVAIDGGVPAFGGSTPYYTYSDERLESVNDLLEQYHLAQPKGFGPGFRLHLRWNGNP